jgi:hypothetical protein
MPSPLQLSAQYRRLPAIRLPYVNRRLGIEIDHLDVICSHCQRPLTAVRGRHVAYASCVDFDVLSLCRPCRCITRFHFRCYDDGRITHDSAAGWVTYDPAEVPWWQRWWRRGWVRLRPSG